MLSWSRTVRALGKISIHKGPYYREVPEILTQRANETDSDSTDEEEIE